MYSSRDTLDALHYGYDSYNLYLRFDQAHLLEHLCGRRGLFEIRISSKEMHQVQFSFADQSLKVMHQGEKIATGMAACGEVLELAVPLAALELKSRVRRSISVVMP